MTDFSFRKITSADRTFVQKVLGNPKVYQYYGVQILSERDAIDQMEWYAELEVKETGQWWLIFDSIHLREIGAIGFNDYVCKKKECEIGFWLDPDWWGKGVISEIFPQLLQNIPQNWDLQTMIAVVETENKNCIQLLKKLNFEFLQTIYNGEVKKGKSIDLELYTYHIQG